MRVRIRWVVGLLASVGVAAGFACSDGSAFQPVTYGAKPWVPPAGWGQPPTYPIQCVVGYYVAIDSCEGCTAISYALCVGTHFSQCACGGPFWTGATCPNNYACSTDDLPPAGWTEYTDYVGPGYIGFGSSSTGGIDAGAD
jgi:hypothetical protein